MKCTKKHTYFRFPKETSLLSDGEWKVVVARRCKGAGVTAGAPGYTFANKFINRNVVLCNLSEPHVHPGVTAHEVQLGITTIGVL